MLSRKCSNCCSGGCRSTLTCSSRSALFKRWRNSAPERWLFPALQAVSPGGLIGPGGSWPCPRIQRCALVVSSLVGCQPWLADLPAWRYGLYGASPPHPHLRGGILVLNHHVSVSS